MPTISLMRFSFKFFIPVLIFILFLPTGYAERGDSVMLDGGSNLLLVRKGYSSFFTDFFERRVGVNLISDNNDRFIENINGYGLAEGYLSGKHRFSFFLKVPRGSSAFSNGLRNGDILSKITFTGGCAFEKANFLESWVLLSSCPSIVRIYRDSRFFNISLPINGNFGSNSLLVLGDRRPKDPWQLNNVTGLSGGMALSLSYLNILSDGNLFSRDKVSATGAIWAHAESFESIVGLDFKINASLENGDTVMLLPENQSFEDVSESTKRRVKLSGLSIYKVSNLSEAVAVLCARGSRSSLCKDSNKILLSNFRVIF